MRRILLLGSTAALTVLLAACSGNNDTVAGHLHFVSGTMIVTEHGLPVAQIGASGTLIVGSKSVTVTAAQRSLLQHYYAQAQDVNTFGAAMGRRSLHFAAHALGDTVSSFFHGNSPAARKQLESQGMHIAAAANGLCTHLKALAAAQTAAAHAVPALVPYAKGNPLSCTVTHTITYSFDGTRVSGSSTGFIGQSGSTAIAASTSIATPPKGPIKVKITFDGQKP